MGWEDRHGRQVYYRKKRIGRRVVSEYVGSTKFAILLARADAMDHTRADRKRREWRKAVEADIAIDRLTHEAGHIVKALTDATLAINGYHRHKGQWRKRKRKRRGKGIET
jgi:hypothetical protein